MKNREEQPVDLTTWIMDGTANAIRGKGKNLPMVNIGRTDSKRGLGFLVTFNKKTERVAFVLDRNQVMALHQHLAYQIPRLRGPKRTRQDLLDDEQFSRERARARSRTRAR
jgi:hypothetical protein